MLATPYMSPSLLQQSPNQGPRPHPHSCRASLSPPTLSAEGAGQSQSLELHCLPTAPESEAPFYRGQTTLLGDMHMPGQWLTAP